MIPVWVVKTRSEIKWHYSAPKPKRGATVEEMPIWHYRGRYVKDDRPVCDGKWVDANGLVAQAGWPEIQAKLEELCPDGEALTSSGTRPRLLRRPTSSHRSMQRR
jgi:hypothetical protein